MCGLKLAWSESLIQVAHVTPHVGVWIETVDSTHININPKVTPHVGVWIET